MLLIYIIIFSLLGSIGALAGAGILLALPKLHDRLKTPLLAYAVGALVGAVFIGLLPEAIDRIPPREVFSTVLVGLLGFFLLEKILRLPHVHAHAGEHHDHGSERHTPHPAGSLILIGDAFHNFVDGIVIATALSASIPLGIVAALAVIAHEIPQELGDFVILLQSDWKRRRA